MGIRQLSRPTGDCNISRVEHLIDVHRGCSNKDLVEQLFDVQEARVIQQIPLSLCGAKDQLIWSQEKHGHFSVKSAYKLSQMAVECSKATAESSHVRQDNREMWTRMWKLPVKPKVKIFLWKCLHDWLATNMAIQKKGMQVDETCRRCGLAKESREYIFFHCVDFVLIWKLAPVSWERFHHLIDPFVHWWRSISTAGHDTQVLQGLEFTIFLLWQIWKSRNIWKF